MSISPCDDWLVLDRRHRGAGWQCIPQAACTPSAHRPAPLHSKPSLKERIVQYAVEAQLPFYVLHLTPIVVIGFYVVQWDVSVLVKFFVITLSSLVVTLLLYDIGVRRLAVTRFLFGMKPKRRHEVELTPR